MKYNSSLQIACTLVIAFTLSLSGVSVVAQDTLPSISLCDYTIPETTYRDLGLSFNYLFYDDPNLSTEGDINKGRASGNYSYLYSNPDYSINLNSDASLSLSDSEFTYDAYGAGRYNFYPIEGDLFAFGGLRVDFSDGFSEIAGVRTTTGTGYGRFENVTPLVKSVLINEMLDDRDVISQNLSRGTIKEIAQDIGAIDPETEIKDVVDDIVYLIEQDASLKIEKLGPIEVLRVRELVQNRIDQRLCGWEVQGGLAYEVLDPQGEKRDFLVNAGARYAHPFTPYSQLFMEVDFASTFQMTENFTMKGLANYTHKISENFDTEFQYFLLYQQAEGDSFYHQTFSTNAEVQVSTNLTTSAVITLTLDTNYEEMAKEITVGLSYDMF